MILDNTIDTNLILENSLTMDIITQFPEGVPYKILMPEIIEISNSLTRQLYLPKEQKLYLFFQSDLRNPILVNGNLQFEFWINARKFIFEQIINKTSFNFKQTGGEELKVRYRNKDIEMTEFFTEYSPEISFVQEDGSIVVIQENLNTVIKPKSGIELSHTSTFTFDWRKMGVNIKIESQGSERKSNSIQYATIHNIVD